MNLENNKFYATGKRKTSIARVFVKKGSGIITINKIIFDYNQKNNRTINIIKKPIELLYSNLMFDITATVKGGGITGQAEAIRHGLSKILVNIDKELYNGENLFKKRLKKFGYITRDSRIVERKKVGRRKARKKEQYSKR